MAGTQFRGPQEAFARGAALFLALLLCGALGAPRALWAQVPAAPGQAPAVPGQPAAPGPAAPGPAGRVAPPAQGAGEPPPVTRRAATEQFYRVSFLELNQYAYTEHPFLQITGDSDFKNGDAASSISNFQTPATASDENVLLKAIHTLPPFGVETGVGYDWVFPKAVSIGFDYSRFSQTDKSALDTSKSVVTIPRIQMDTYFYSIFARAYAFNPNEPGINFYLGIGLGILEGKFDAIPYAGAKTERVGFSQTPVGMTQMGVETAGENFGLRYEVRLMRARKVHLDKNPYLDQQDVTTIDFSGTMIRISIFYQF